ncbi:MAG: diacylglycerol kinase family protein [Candidatus Daviesbacteria bacterium]|nr:diacylglycerol kinase family protein [Candidatus Daviesbacteria bacterium]
MDNKKGSKFSPKRIIRSFKFAFEGIWTGIKSEANWTIGIIEAMVVIWAGFYLNISKSDWIIVILLISLVLYAELCNSAIEAIVDSFTPEEHPKAKLAKDFSAGSVVILIIASAIIGWIIFWPYISLHFSK